MSAITTRVAVDDDLDDVLALWREADAAPTHTDNRDSLAALIARDPEALILAVSGTRVVGSVIAGWDGWRGGIYRLVVAPAHRREGLGRRLLREAEQHLARRGAVRSHAIVVESDPQALGFWQASGWSKHADRARFVKG